MPSDQEQPLTPECRATRHRLGPELDRVPADVAAHLAGCSDCRAEARRLGSAWALLNIVAPTQPSPQFARGVWARIADSPSAPNPGWTGLPAWSLRGVAAAAAVVLLSVVPVAVWHQGPHDRPELVAQVDVINSQELLTDLEVVEDLDVLLLLDDP